MYEEVRMFEGKRGQWHVFAIDNSGIRDETRKHNVSYAEAIAHHEMLLTPISVPRITDDYYRALDMIGAAIATNA